MRYGTLMIDPPWQYGGCAVVGAGGRGYNDGSRQVGVERGNHYATMSMRELEQLPVSTLAMDNSHLYLWFTNAFGEEAHQLAKVWGFCPKTIITWAKVKASSFEASMKTGYYFRGASEHVLFATRGKAPTTQTPARPTWYALPREPHSVKPQFFFDLAREQSPGPYVELFARRRRDFWDAWGNEVTSNVVAFECADLLK